MNQKLYDCYVSILERELVPAMGCTVNPIRQTL